MTIASSKYFSDELDLVGANVGESGEDDLFVGSKHLIKTLDGLFLCFSDLRTTSHLINII